MRFILGLVLLAGSAWAAEDSPLLHALRTRLPPEVPVRVLIAAASADRLSVDPGGQATTTSITVDEPGWSTARRVVNLKAAAQAYHVQVFSPPSDGAVHKGDVILVSYWVRSPGAAGETGVVEMRCQLPHPPWTAVVSGAVACGNGWQQQFAAGIAAEEVPAGGFQVVWQVGGKAQTIDLGGVLMVNLGPGVDLRRLPFSDVTYPGRAADASWRVEASQRIARYRQGTLGILVQDAAGRPVPGATVNLHQRRLAFGLGSFTGYDITQENAQGAAYRDHFALFNRATTPIYWADWGWPQKRTEFLAIAAWAKERGLDRRAHPIIYPGWAFLPTAVRALERDPSALQTRLLAHIREICAATAPFAYREYDVTNELRDLAEIHTLVGKDGVAAWFAEARRHLPPGTKLALNENTILTRGGITEANQQTYLGWIDDLAQRGQKPDVIGFQGHFDEVLTAPERIWGILDRFAATGCELQITEFDINTRNEAVQGDYTRDFLTAVFAHPAVSACTLWGFWEGDIWQHDAALYRRDWTAKPNGRALEELVRSWRTDATATTAADGRVRLSGYRGTYDVRVGSGTRVWHGSSELAADTALTVTLPE